MFPQVIPVGMEPVKTLVTSKFVLASWSATMWAAETVSVGGSSG
jgi:hypothetical protein